MTDFWDWSYAWSCVPLLAKAAVVTVQATILAYLIALAGGLALALLRRSRNRILARVFDEVNEAIRSTPLLVQIYFLYFVGPQLGLTLSAWATGLIALGLHYSSYTSEVYRAGLENVPKGQWEASKALNFGRLRSFRNIILPQAIPPMIPVFGNYLISMFKETPLLSVITIIELMARAKLIGNDQFRYTEPVTLVGVFFLLASLVSAKGVDLAEHYFNKKEHRRAK